MDRELTKDEVSFIVECVKMAEQEGFYLLDCHYNFDIKKTGEECLRKIGIKEGDIKYCFDPRPYVICERGKE